MHRKLIIIIGAMRSGKSFFSNSLITQYNAAGQSALVYNLGRPTDFKNAKPGFLMNKNEHIKEVGKDWKQSPYFYGFSDEKENKIDIKDFNKNYYKSALKVPRIDSITERLFLEAYFDYISNNLFIIDDARALFRYGVKAEFLQLFSRINHSGIKHTAPSWRAKGTDIILIFHSIDHVNPEIWDYATHLINFKYAMEPDFKSIENKQIRQQVKTSFHALAEAPRYSYTVTDIHNLKTLLNLKK